MAIITLNNNSLSSVTALPAGVGGKVLQVVTTTKTDTFSSSTQQSFTDITGMSATITPSSTSNKILVLATINSDAGSNAHIRLVRNTTPISIGDSAGSRSQVTGASSRNAVGGDDSINNGITFLDSPSSTSALTYKFQFYLWSSSFSWYLNRPNGDGDGGYTGRSASTITLMEIAG